MLKEQILKYSRQNNIATLSAWFSRQLDYLISKRTYLEIDELLDIGQNITNELVQYRKKFSIDNAVIGMSGGVDSALTAALFKAADWNVLGVTLPIYQKPEETARGIEACQALGIEHWNLDLTAQYETLLSHVRLYDKTIDQEQNYIRRGNLRVRSRMITLYNIASMKKGLVASTDNFSELAAGFWTLHGDVGDLAPIQSLLKSWEVPKLAEIFGVPESTVFATPTDGLGISQGDEDQFGFSYLEFDIILMLLYQNKCNFTNRSEILHWLNAAPEDNDKINKILDRIKFSSFKRKNPYNIKHPVHDDRYQGLESIDQCLWHNK